MEFHDTQEYTGERLYVRRHGVPPTAISRSMPNQADNSYGFPTQASGMYGEWPFGGVDRKPHLANTDSYHSPGYSLHKRPGTAHPLNEDYGPRQYNQGSSTHASNKRNIDVDSMGANSHKRYRLSSPDQMQTFGGCPDNSKSKRLHGIEGALKYEYDGEPSYHIKNIEHHRYYEIQQPQAVSASQRQAAFLPPQRPRTNINTIQNSYSPTKQGVRRILDYGIPPQPSRNMTSTTHRISRSQEPNSFSLRPEGLQRSRETGYPPAPKTFNCSQPLESGVLIKGSPQSSNSSLTLPDTTVPQLGSPLWKTPSRRDTSIYGPVRERLPGHIDQYQGMSQIRRSVTPKLEHGTGYAAQSRIAPNVQQTSRMILTQISKDSDSKNETPARRLPRQQNSLSQHSAAPVYTGRDALHITRDPIQQSPQAQSASQKWDDFGEDSEVSDSTPMEHIFERQRYDKSRSQSDSNRNPYKVASVLPRTGIFAKERPATKPTVPQIDNIREFSGNDAHSPICVDSPPGSPVRTPLIPKSVPMSVRLSPAKVKPNSKARIDPAYDKQRRAAELIIKKEREMLDKEIFGEVIGDIFQENNAETNLAHTESRQKRDRQEASRLIQEEMQKTIDLEIKREAAERERRRKEEEEEKKRAKREIERKKQRGVEEAQKEERRKMTQKKIEASRLKEIAEREKREQERQKEKVVQPDAANRTEMELRKEIAKLRAASLKPATAIPSISKKSQEKGLFFDDEEDSLFVPETNQRSVKQSLNHAINLLTLLIVVNVKILAPLMVLTMVLMIGIKRTLQYQAAWQKYLLRSQTFEVAFSKSERNWMLTERLKPRKNGVKFAKLSLLPEMRKVLRSIQCIGLSLGSKTWRILEGRIALLTILTQNHMILQKNIATAFLRFLPHLRIAREQESGDLTNEMNGKMKRGGRKMARKRARTIVNGCLKMQKRATTLSPMTRLVNVLMPS